MPDNKSTARQFALEVFGHRNFAFADQIWTEDYLCHDTLEGETDAAEAKRQIAELAADFPDLTLEVFEVFGEGDFVAMRWRAHGTHQGAFMGIEPTGRACAFDGVSLLRFEDGRISEQWDQWDALGLFRQLGAVQLEREGAPQRAQTLEAHPVA